MSSYKWKIRKELCVLCGLPAVCRTNKTYPEGKRFIAVCKECEGPIGIENLARYKEVKNEG